MQTHPCPAEHTSAGDRGPSKAVLQTLSSEGSEKRPGAESVSWSERKSGTNGKERREGDRGRERTELTQGEGTQRRLGLLGLIVTSSKGVPGAVTRHHALLRPRVPARAQARTRPRKRVLISAPPPQAGLRCQPAGQGPWAMRCPRNSRAWAPGQRGAGKQAVRVPGQSQTPKGPGLSP